MKCIPDRKQLDFLDWEFGVFFHFGIRSFYPGHKDWDGKRMPPEAFQPSALDCESWIRTAKEAGATYTVLTTKHHDGFALWPSAYSSYTVAHTPWKNGRGDVVREYVNACRKYQMKIGLYYSPAQWGDLDLKQTDPQEYDTYFIHQLTELLTNYGKIDYLWFDGCGSEGHEYDKQRIVAEIFRLQPDILTFCDPEWTPCVRWIGNEDGYASLDNPLVVSSTDFSELATEEQKLSEAAFLPAECDCKIRHTWFYDDNEDTLKSVEELFGMYEMSVGHGSNFLLNIGPDSRGLLPEADGKRLLELGDRIRKTYSNPLEYSHITQEAPDAFSIVHTDFGMPWGSPVRAPLSNRVEITEDLADGQSVKKFRLYAHLPVYQKKRILVYEGSTIGHKLICPFGAIRSPKFTLEILDHDGGYKLKSMKAYFAD